MDYSSVEAIDAVKDLREYQISSYNFRAHKMLFFFK